MTTRRHLLRLAGRLAAASAFSPFARVFAAPNGPFTPPKNLVLVYHPMGLEPGWKPTLGPSGLVFGQVLSALQPFANLTTVVHGLSAGIRNEVMAHAEGMTSLWTGSLIAKPDEYASSPSIDQLLVERLQPDTPLPSLELGVQTQEGFGANGNAVVMVYGRQGRRIAEDDPRGAFNRLFVTAASPAELARVRQERASVLDLVRADANRVRQVVGSSDRQKLEAHLDGLRALEVRFDALAGLRCESAVAPTLAGAEYKRTERFSDVAELQEDVLTQALACGVTRVASLQYSNTVNDRRIAGINPSVGFHTVMHSGTRQEKALLNQYFACRVASLLGKLQRADVLKDTLVVWASEMAVGNHLRNPVPFFVFGGQPNTGFFQHQRLLEAPGQRTTRLLLSVLHAFGLNDLQQLGDLRDESSRGPLPGISRVTP